MGKPRKTCVEVAGRRTFRILTSNQLSGKKWPVNLACYTYSHINYRVLLHSANLRHGTDGFTSPPKKGMLWIYSSEISDGFVRVRTRDLRYH
jgi:hypothetical protein